MTRPRQANIAWKEFVRLWLDQTKLTICITGHLGWCLGHTIIWVNLTWLFQCLRSRATSAFLNQVILIIHIHWLTHNHIHAHINDVCHWSFYFLSPNAGLRNHPFFQLLLSINFFISRYLTYFRRGLLSILSVKKHLFLPHIRTKVVII